jgi:hypothetical protein
MFRGLEHAVGRNMAMRGSKNEDRGQLFPHDAKTDSLPQLPNQGLFKAKVF